MFEFGFVQDYTWLVMIVSGLIGLLYSGEKVLSVLPFVGNTEDKNTKLMKWLSIIMGIVASVWVALLVLDDVAEFSWLTIVLFSAFIIVSLAHPIRGLEGWKVIIIAVPFVFLTILVVWFKKDKNFTIFGMSISLLVVLIAVSILMLLLFVLVFFVEETVVDPTLWFLGWAPFKVIVCVLVIMQGVSLIFNPVDGFLAVLGG